jgi:hypothetical protein
MSLTQSLQSGPSKVTIFGREPSVWVGLIESGLAALTAFGIGQWAGLTQETYGTWVVLIAALSGFLTAFLTKDTMLGVTLGLAKAVIAFIAIYGLSLTDQQTDQPDRLLRAREGRRVQQRQRGDRSGDRDGRDQQLQRR